MRGERLVTWSMMPGRKRILKRGGEIAPACCGDDVVQPVAVRKRCREIIGEACRGEVLLHEVCHAADAICGAQLAGAGFVQPDFKAVRSCEVFGPHEGGPQLGIVQQAPGIGKRLGRIPDRRADD